MGNEHEDFTIVKYKSELWTLCAVLITIISECRNDERLPVGRLPKKHRDRIKPYGQK